MSEDPREILKSAGVECAEVDALYVDGRYDMGKVDDYADDVILALARLVAKYKWQRDEDIRIGYVGGDPAPDVFADAVADLERRWEEREKA